MNPLKRLGELGQSVWIDFIRRDLFSGSLQNMIDADGLCGMTSNPTIFEKAIGETELYDEDIRNHFESGMGPAEICEALAVTEVVRAADVFRPVYAASGGNDGFVSIEVRPSLAHNTDESIVEARRLWRACNRPNVLVKIPGTSEGMAAVRQCLSEGINVNITLLFSVERYHAVMEAYLLALESRVAADQSVAEIRSVASFFVSRVDNYVDQKLDAIVADPARSPGEQKLAKDLRGKVAIANARNAYHAFAEIVDDKRYAALKAKNVAAQRPLWASTSTKDPLYPDVYYVEALVAPDTVNTMPLETFIAYKDHGQPRIRILDDLALARTVSQKLAELGIDEAKMYKDLEDEGVKKFADSYGHLVEKIVEKEKAMRVS